jgi:hypothetical protein
VLLLLLRCEFRSVLLLLPLPLLSLLLFPLASAQLNLVSDHDQISQLSVHNVKIVAQLLQVVLHLSLLLLLLGLLAVLRLRVNDCQFHISSSAAAAAAAAGHSL